MQGCLLTAVRQVGQEHLHDGRGILRVIAKALQDPLALPALLPGNPPPIDRHQRQADNQQRQQDLVPEAHGVVLSAYAGSAGARSPPSAQEKSRMIPNVGRPGSGAGKAFYLVTGSLRKTRSTPETCGYGFEVVTST
jgi:hypothetical protein